MHTIKLYLLFTFLGICIAENKYFISPGKATFIQALGFCRRFGMKLVSINTEEKNSDLYSHLTRLNESHEWYWTCGIFQNNTMTREWYWLEADWKIEFTDWRQNDVPIEPSYHPDTDNCLRFGMYDIENARKGLWRVEDCTSFRRFICERPYAVVKHLVYKEFPVNQNQ